MCVPKLRFPEFSRDWGEFKFGEYLDVKSGYGFKASEYVEEGVPLVKIDNVTYGKIKWDTITYLPNNYLEKYPDLVLEEGDILLALNRPITQNKLKIGILNKKNSPAILYQRVGKIILKSESVDKTFSYYNLINYIYTFVKKSSVGSDQPFISTIELKKLKIILPSLSEQQKIASFLSKVDEKIDKLEKKQELWETYKKGIMQQIFSQKLRFKDENGEDYPDWEEKNFGNIAELFGRIGFRGYKTSDLVEKGEGALTLGGKHISKNNKIDLKDPEYLSWEKYYESPEIIVELGDIITAQRGTLGRSALINEDIGPATINPSMILIKNAKILNIYLYYYISSNRFKKNVIVNSSSTAVPMISQSEMKKIKIWHPIFEEQEKIASFLSIIDNKIDLIESELEINEKFKKSLLQQMFC